MMIVFSNVKAASYIGKLPYHIWPIYDEINSLCREHGTYAMITSTWRKRTTDTGIHEAGLAIDVIPITPLSMEVCRDIEKIVNKKFPYGKPPYNTCWYHGDDDGAGYHWHVQVRPI